jgi:uncharacterized protein YegP (UPF0339 family)
LEVTVEFQVYDSEKPLSQSHYWLIVDGLTVLAKSEMLSSFSAAWSIAKRVKEETWAFTFTTFTDVTGKYRWRITGRNGEIVTSSTQGHQFKWQADEQRDKVKQNAPSAVLVPKTERR